MGTCNFVSIISLTILLAPVLTKEYEFDPNSIPHISTQKLKNIISSGNEAVLVYFYGDFKECPECERLLPKFHEAVEYLHKLDDGKVVSYKLAMKFPEYGINSLPQMVLFIQDTPFLYDGSGREDAWETNDVLEWVEEAKQTPIQELTDETFEHLTQSSTGATTGDWIILFGDRSKPECLKPHLSVIGTVGVRLRMRKNVAYVDTSKSESVSKRFADVLPSTCASVLLVKKIEVPMKHARGNLLAYSFHRTELYKVPIEDFSVSSLLYFVLEGYQKVEHIEVPQVQSEPPPGGMTADYASYAKDMPSCSCGLGDVTFDRDEWTVVKIISPIDNKSGNVIDPSDDTTNPHLEQLIQTLNGFIKDYGRTHTVHAVFLAIVTLLVLGVILFLVKKFRKRKLL